MDDPLVQINQLAQAVVDEIVGIISGPRHSLFAGMLRPVLWPAARRLAQLAMAFDERVARDSFGDAARWVLPHFVSGFEARGVESIPRQGPLMITANHPGSCDALLISASVPRKDLKIVATDIPFLRGLRRSAPHFIHVSRKDCYRRMVALRSVIAHLRAGGAVLIFPSGHIDPDPAVVTDTESDVQGWSRSVELCIRHVPQTQVLVTMVSGVLAQVSWRSPIARLWPQLSQRCKIAQIIQIVQQMWFERQFAVKPLVAFGHPFMPGGKPAGHAADTILDCVVDEARRVWAAHAAPGSLAPS